MASQIGRTEVVKLLLRHLNGIQIDFSQNIALQLAEINGHKEIITLILTNL